jgi:hypothetical protein|nr:MAG TPA: Chromatin remodeling complex ATPase [Caudoviricetes sp.]
MKLYPYQRQGVNKMLSQSSIFLCDDMGLGKTAQVCTVIKERNKFPTVVVCPAPLKESWKRELYIWANITVDTDDLSSKVIIISYKKLTDYLPRLKQIGVKQVIFDECHMLKTPTSNRTKAALELVRGVRYRIMITGTPVLNRPKELLCQLEIAGLTYKFGGSDRFLQTFCGQYQSPWWSTFDGHSNLGQLNQAMHKVWIRRLKSEVQNQLPPKQIYFIPCCTVAQDEPTSFGEIEKFDAEVLRIKLPFCINYIRKELERGDSIVVFAHHRNIIAKLRKEFPDAKVIIGGQSQKNRQQNIDKFQYHSSPSANYNLIICSLQASSVGITLTKAHKAIFIEYPWSPSIMAQAQDRIHRIGQTQPCEIIYLYAKDSIDEYRLRTQNIKQIVINHTMKEVKT